MRRSLLALWTSSAISWRDQKTWMVMRGTVCSPSAASALASISAIGLAAGAAGLAGCVVVDRPRRGEAGERVVARERRSPPDLGVRSARGVANSVSASKSRSNGSVVVGGLRVMHHC